MIDFPNSFEPTTRGYLRGNKSFVIRAARMSDHQRRMIEAYRLRWCIPFVRDNTAFLDVGAVFGTDRTAAPLIVDIGFGMGETLAEIATAQRDRNFIGIEVHPPGVGRLLGQLADRQLTNVRIVQFDAIEVLQRLFPPESIDGIHLFFPDPWPKKRHWKRRMVQSGFPELIAPLLKSEGYVYMVTDWEDYALQMAAVFDAVDSFRNPFDGFAPPQSWRPRTAFERKGLAKNHQIRELRYVRV